MQDAIKNPLRRVFYCNTYGTLFLVFPGAAEAAGAALT